jgi:hypothetical protein
MNVILKIEGSVCGEWEERRNRLTWIAREFQHRTNGKLTRPLDPEQQLLISLLLRTVGVLLQMMDPSHHGISVLQFAFGGFFPCSKFCSKVLYATPLFVRVQFFSHYVHIAGCTKDQWFSVAGRVGFQDYHWMYHVY